MKVNSMSSWVPLIVITAIGWFVFTPISIYYLSKLSNRRRDHAFTRTSHWQISFWFGIFCLFAWCVERPLHFFCELQSWQLVHVHAMSSEIAAIIQTILFPIAMHSIVWCIVCRCWLVWYNLKFYEETMNMQWKIIINDTNYTRQKQSSGGRKFNWFLAHRSRLGTLSWLAPRILFVFCLLMSVVIFAEFYDQMVIKHMVDAMVLFSCLFMLCCLWFNTPLLQRSDLFPIRLELKYIIVVLVTEYLFYFGCNLALTLPWTQSTHVYPLTLMVVETLSGMLFAFVALLLFTKHTLYKCDQKTDPRTVSVAPLATVSSTKNGNTPAMANKSQSSLLSPRGKSMKLYQWLPSNEGFNAFMNHLMSEYNHETLLFIIETLQFKQALSVAYTSVLGELELQQSAQSQQSQQTAKSEASESQSPVPKTTHIPLAHIQQHSEIECTLQSLQHKMSHSSSFEGDSQVSIVSTQSVATQLHQQHTLQSLTSNTNSLLSSSSIGVPKPGILSLQFPPCVPQSFIVLQPRKQPLCKNDVLLQFKSKALRIFEKYIYNGQTVCPYEINVNYAMRKKFIDLTKKQREWMQCSDGFDALYVLFDESILEMYDLCTHSFLRFKQTPHFVKLDKKFFR